MVQEMAAVNIKKDSKDDILRHPKFKLTLMLV